MESFRFQNITQSLIGVLDKSDSDSDILEEPKPRRINTTCVKSIYSKHIIEWL